MHAAAQRLVAGPDEIQDHLRTHRPRTSTSSIPPSIRQAIAASPYGVSCRADADVNLPPGPGCEADPLTPGEAGASGARCEAP